MVKVLNGVKKEEAIDTFFYTHGVMNLGVSAYRCVLDLVFPIDDCMDAGDSTQGAEHKGNAEATY